MINKGQKKGSNNKLPKGVSSFIIAASIIVVLLLKQLGIVDLTTILNSDSRGSLPKNADTETVLGNLQSKKLIYTKHARCRMGCRYISESEVKDMLKSGHINYRKSSLDSQPCPTYAVEGVTKDEQEVRIVFANCDDIAKVITTIDLGNKYECHCN